MHISSTTKLAGRKKGNGKIGKRGYARAKIPRHLHGDSRNASATLTDRTSAIGPRDDPRERSLVVRVRLSRTSNRSRTSERVRASVRATLTDRTSAIVPRDDPRERSLVPTTRRVCDA